MTTVQNSGAKCPSLLTGYYGYVGINGQISTPTQLPLPVPPLTHSAGYPCQNYSCVKSTSAYMIYVEFNHPTYGYTAFPVSGLALGQSIIYRIQFLGGCIYAYYFSSTLAYYHCGLGYNSGMAVATNESTDKSNTWDYQTMPHSTFGSTTPNTNNTLRLYGSNGWSDWSSTVPTGQYDSRPYYYYSKLAANYAFTTYGAIR